MRGNGSSRATVLEEIVWQLEKLEYVLLNASELSLLERRVALVGMTGTEPGGSSGVEYVGPISDAVWKHYRSPEKLAEMEAAAGEAFSPSRLTGEKADFLVEKAADEPLAFDAATSLAAAMLEQGEVLPTNLAFFAAMVLRGEKKRPRQRGRSASENHLKNFIIWTLVEYARKRNFVATRNDGTEPGDTACDIVADALKMRGMQPTSYERVQNIWSEGNRRGLRLLK